MNKTMSIALDVCYDATTLEAVLFELSDGLASITCRIVQHAGPGGGWPVVRFAGSEADVEALVRRYDPIAYAELLEDRAA